MSDTETADTDSIQSVKKKITVKGKVKKNPPKKLKKKHEEKSEGQAIPQKKKPVKELVDEALIILYHRKGTSLRAIKKHISEHNNYDEKGIKRISSRITYYVKECFQNETLLQVTGTGATGSFKLVTNPKVAKAKEKSKPDERKEKPDKKEKSDKKGKSDKENPEKKPKEKKMEKPKEGKVGAKPKEKLATPEKEVKLKDMEKLKKARTSVGVTVKRKSIHAKKLKPRLKKGEKVIKEGKKKTEKDEVPNTKTRARKNNMETADN